MDEVKRTYPVPDLGQFEQNRPNFPPEALIPYAGKYIAWNLEGTRVLASGESRDDVDEKLAAMGIHFSQVVHDYVDEM